MYIDVEVMLRLYINELQKLMIHPLGQGNKMSYLLTGFEIIRALQGYVMNIEEKEKLK